MLRRSLLVLVLLAAAIYALLPAERKTRVLGRLREVWRALVVTLVIYWIYMISLALWRRWKSG